jgi:glutathione synthase/RimK-type ligase-like ATP-grasp enzyme
MNEAVKLGIPTYWSEPTLILASHKLNALRVRRYKGNFELGEIEQVPASQFWQAHYRVDPPVNENYFAPLSVLEATLGSRVLNPPELLRNQSEKVPPIALKNYSPVTVVVRHAADVATTWQELSAVDELVIKPWGEAQSKGVHRATKPLLYQEWIELMQKETLGFTRAIVLQEYLDGIVRGELRAWFIYGEFLGALRKYPLQNSFLVSVDAGSRIEKYDVTPEDQHELRALGAVLAEQGAALAAIDWIPGPGKSGFSGAKISDYNITSPGLLVQLEQVHGKNFSKDAIEILKRHKAH